MAAEQMESTMERKEREDGATAKEPVCEESILLHVREAIKANTEHSAYYAALLHMLQQKEDDVRLAAHLGESLVKENARLRGAAREEESLRQRYATSEAELLTARDEIRSLERRLDISATRLSEADELVHTLQSELQAAKALQADAKTSPQGTAPNPLPTSITDSVSSPSFDNLDPQTWQTLGSEKQEKDEERLQEELEKLSKLMEASEVEKIDLKGQIGSLESKARKSAIELSTVRARLLETQLENNRLVADLREAREILREASLKAAESLSHGKSHGEVSIEEEVKESNGHEVDIYFFHFHMLAMSIKAKTVHAHPEMPRELLEAMNKLNLKEIYREVLDTGVPPHDWYQYIYDLYASVQLQALMRSNTVKRVYTPSPSTPSSTGNNFEQSPAPRKSSFTRFIGAMSDRLISSPNTKLHPRTTASPF